MIKPGVVWGNCPGLHNFKQNNSGQLVCLHDDLHATQDTPETDKKKSLVSF